MSDHDIQTADREGPINRLVALRRKELSDEFLTDYDETNDDGEKIDTVGDGETNLSRLLGPAPSVTRDIEMLRLEAEMLAEGRDLGNPHIPATTDIRDRALAVIEDAGHRPAWLAGTEAEGDLEAGEI